MKTIEIKQSKKTLIPMLIVMSCALIGTTYYNFFYEKVENNYAMKIIYVLLNTYLLYAIYVQTRKFIKNEPVLTFSKDKIEINEKGKPYSLQWSQINNWKIEEEGDGGAQYLKIMTSNGFMKINISWLDKNPDEINELLKMYKEI
jgi:hypothetical protein